ncbi:MAG: tetratricopeptide repeat protein, partial [Hormoscilla sp. SP12CHS1]|nr:tetratricopeptide repeat protein [Hormoscilla sp. SP12CHS1]
LSRYDEAIASYDKAIEIKPDDYEAWNNRGKALYQLSRYDEALASYDKAIEIKRDDYEAWRDDCKAWNARVREQREQRRQREQQGQWTQRGQWTQYGAGVSRYDTFGDSIQLTGYTTATNGTVSRDDNGTAFDQTDDRLIYTSNSGFTGTDNFTYSISDGNGATDTVTVNITVTPASEDVLQLRITPSEPTKAVVPNNPVSFDVNYSTAPAETPTTGIAFRMHWDSSQVALDPVTGLTNRFPLGAQPTGVEDDPVTNGALDGDPNYVNL